MGRVEAAPCQVDAVLAGELVGASGTHRDIKTCMKWKHQFLLGQLGVRGKKMGFDIFTDSNPSSAFC